MVKRLFLVLHTFSLIALAYIIAIAQNGQSSRSNAQSDRIVPAATRKVWFDVASNAHPRNSAEVSELMVKLIRQIGVKRILYGTDVALGNTLPPREAWEAFRGLKLSNKEIRTIAGNVTPYFR